MSEEIVFSQESLAYWKKLEKITWQSIRKLVIGRVLDENRYIITAEDIEVCLPQAIREIAAETKIGGNDFNTPLTGFTYESLTYWTKLQNMVWECIRKLVKESTLTENLNVITAENIKTYLPQAIQEVFNEIGIDVSANNKNDVAICQLLSECVGKQDLREIAEIIIDSLESNEECNEIVTLAKNYLFTLTNTRVNASYDLKKKLKEIGFATTIY